MAETDQPRRQARDRDQRRPLVTVQPGEDDAGAYPRSRERQGHSRFPAAPEAFQGIARTLSRGLSP